MKLENADIYYSSMGQVRNELLSLPDNEFRKLFENDGELLGKFLEQAWAKTEWVAINKRG